MKNLLLLFAVIIAFSSCQKEGSSPQYIEKTLYTGDSVRYDFDSLPSQIIAAPSEYSKYYKLIQVYNNNTLVIDYTHLLKDGYSVTYRGFVRFTSYTNFNFKGWYKRRIKAGYIIPIHREVVIYHTMDYNVEQEIKKWEEKNN